MPPPGVKVSASSRGPKTAHGIQHKTSHPKRLRCMNEAVPIRKQTLREKREAKGETWKADEDMPPLGAKVSASSRDPKTVHGIQHKTSPAKRRRESLNKKTERNAAHERAVVGGA